MKIEELKTENEYLKSLIDSLRCQLTNALNEVAKYHGKKGELCHRAFEEKCPAPPIKSGVAYSNGKLNPHLTAIEVCDSTTSVEKWWNQVNEIKKERDALYEFINREMKMNANDPRIKELKTILNK